MNVSLDTKGIASLVRVLCDRAAVCNEDDREMLNTTMCSVRTGIVEEMLRYDPQSLEMRELVAAVDNLNVSIVDLEKPITDAERPFIGYVQLVADEYLAFMKEHKVHEDADVYLTMTVIGDNTENVTVSFRNNGFEGVVESLDYWEQYKGGTK